MKRSPWASSAAGWLLWGMLVLAGGWALAQAPATSASPDQLKSQLWARTARWVWQTQPIAQPPQLDSLPLEELRVRLKKTGNTAGVFELYNFVDQQLPRGGMALAPPAAVEQAILARLRAKRQGNAAELKRVDELEQQLRQILGGPAGTPAASVERPAADSMTAVDGTSTAALTDTTALRVAAQADAPELLNQAATRTPVSAPANIPAESGSSSSVLLILLGAVLGAGVVWLLLRKKNAPAEPAPIRTARPTPNPEEAARTARATEARESRTALNDNYKKGLRQPGKAGTDGRAGTGKATRQSAPSAKKTTLPPNRTMDPKPTPPVTPPAPAELPYINELIDESASVPAPPLVSAELASTEPLFAEAPQPEPEEEPAGPLQFYAPAPDVPSIEHRKLSPHPLPQMPLLIVLPTAEATRAEYSFSPQADQSRIIGNGVRELKEFFAFELPPTEQFTTIRNLAAGRLEKRDGTWHVVQKASIVLS